MTALTIPDDVTARTLLPSDLGDINVQVWSAPRTRRHRSPSCHAIPGHLTASTTATQTTLTELADDTNQRICRRCWPSAKIELSFLAGDLQALTTDPSLGELHYVLTWGNSWRPEARPRGSAEGRQLRGAVLAASVGLHLEDLTAGVVGVVPAVLFEWLFDGMGALPRPTWSTAPVGTHDDATAVATTATALLGADNEVRRVTRLLAVARTLLAA